MAAASKEEHFMHEWRASRWSGAVVAAGLAGAVLSCSALAAENQAKPKAPPPPPPTITDGKGGPAAMAKLRAELKKLPYGIVYESYRGSDWELYTIRADGSGGANLTNSPKTADLYPHASPDGRRVCFVVDEGAGGEKARNVYCINADGTGRTLVATNARQPCWGPDSKRIAYLKGEFERFTYKDFASKGVFVYDTAARTHTPHVNDKLHHLYNLCWSSCGKWYTATVHGGMGFKHANLVFAADGQAVHAMEPVGGCRPDISPDGKRICWNRSDQVIAVADLDLTASPPKVTNVRHHITCDKAHEVYHADWSPDGRFIAFSYGPKAGEQVGTMAKGWHICVADAARPDVWVVLTKDGISNKEADWLPRK
jgi:dipeptidyl aminopeptidase/acylaminoacyl peptidase